MALDPLELLTIGAVLVVFFLWGPQKIPELARAIGQARREFDNASREVQKVTTGLQNGSGSFFASAPPAPSPQVRSALPQSAAAAPPASPAVGTPPTYSSNKTGDELLIEAARRLGIHTQGKTREQIEEEIVEVAHGPSAKKDAPAPPPAKDPATTT